VINKHESFISCFQPSESQMLDFVTQRLQVPLLVLKNLLVLFFPDNLYTWEPYNVQSQTYFLSLKTHLSREIAKLDSKRWPEFIVTRLRQYKMKDQILSKNHIWRISDSHLHSAASHPLLIMVLKHTPFEKIIFDRDTIGMKTTCEEINLERNHFIPKNIWGNF